MSELITFRVYPESKSLYARVNIWPSAKAMREHDKLGRNHDASCGAKRSWFVGKGPDRKTGLFAEMNFHRRALAIDVVVHEMAHAAFCWVERRKLSLNEVIEDHGDWSARKKPETIDQDGVEEQFCYALGRMCDQFMSKCYDMGLGI